MYFDVNVGEILPYQRQQIPHLDTFPTSAVSDAHVETDTVHIFIQTVNP